MARSAELTAALLALVVAVIAGCGGGSKNAAAPLPKAPTLTVPGEKTTPAVPKKSGTTTADTTTSTAASTVATPTTTAPTATSTPAGGAAPPQTGGASPGTQTQTSSSPSGGTPAQRFEQFCKDNPGAC